MQVWLPSASACFNLICFHVFMTLVRLGWEGLRKERAAPLWSHAVVASSVSLTRGFTLVSLTFITYPTSTLLSSSSSSSFVFLFLISVRIAVFPRSDVVQELQVDCRDGGRNFVVSQTLYVAHLCRGSDYHRYAPLRNFSRCYYWSQLSVLTEQTFSVESFPFVFLTYMSFYTQPVPVCFPSQTRILCRRFTPLVFC